MTASKATRESLRCFAAVTKGGDPAFWKRRLRATIAIHEREIAVLRGRLEWLNDQPQAPRENPTCATCKDTHRMQLRDGAGDSRDVMCTHCPVPCKLCRSGAYCWGNPCECDCHKKAKP